LDIHLSYVHNLYFPYQADYFACFFLKIKNKALGYVAPFMEEKKEKAREKGKKEAEKEAEEEEIVKFEPKMLDIPAPLVSQPLPLFFKTKKLEPGEYILEITIKDKIGKKEGLGKINFIIK